MVLFKDTVMLNLKSLERAKKCLVLGNMFHLHTETPCTEELLNKCWLPDGGERFR